LHQNRTNFGSGRKQTFDRDVKKAHLRLNEINAVNNRFWNYKMFVHYAARGNGSRDYNIKNSVVTVQQSAQTMRGCIGSNVL